MGWLSASLSHPDGPRALTSCVAALLATMVVMGCYWQTHSLVLMSSAWLSLLAFFSLFSSLYSMSISYRPTTTFSYGLARVPVLAVFSTTVLAQLFSVFLTKESFEHILSPDHHGSGHDAGHTDAHDETHGSPSSPSLPYYLGALSSSIALLLSAYSLKNQPFQHVLTASSSSSVQEHAADISQALCWLVPGLSRLLLPRINTMVLLAALSSTLIVIDEHFRHELAWADPVCCLALSVIIFSSMWPLTSYTGRILLQTAPPHLLNQLDRCMAESSHVEGVLELRSPHFWQLDFASLAGTVDVRVMREADEQKVLAAVTEKLSSIVPKLTVQIVKDASWQPSGYGEQPSPAAAAVVYHDEHHGHSHGGEGAHGHSHAGGGQAHSHEGAHAHSH